jgi:hypothetical protein
LDYWPTSALVLENPSAEMAVAYRRKTTHERMSRSKLTRISRNRTPFGKNTGNFYRQTFFAAADMAFLPSFMEFRDHLAIFQAIVSC